MAGKKLLGGVGKSAASGRDGSELTGEWLRGPASRNHHPGVSKRQGRDRGFRGDDAAGMEREPTAQSAIRARPAPVTTALSVRRSLPRSAMVSPTRPSSAAVAL